MKCANCGKEIEDYSVFCLYCGQKVSKPKEAVPDVLPNQVPKHLRERLESGQLNNAQETEPTPLPFVPGQESRTAQYEPDAAEPEQPAAEIMVKRKNQKTMWIIGVQILFLILIAIAVLLLVWYHRNQKQQNGADGAPSVVQMEKTTSAAEASESTSEEATEEATEAVPAETKPPKAEAAATQTVKAADHLDQPEKVEDSADTADYSSESNGTTSGNIFNGGFLASDGIYQYYRADDGYLYKAKNGENTASCVLKKEIWYINVQGPWLYFANDSDQCLAKVKTDGSDYQVLYTGAVHEVTVDGSWIYFGTENALNRVKTDGSGLQKLVSGNTWFLNLDGNKLYFDLLGNERQMCSCNLDGSGLEVLVSSGVYDLLIYGGNAYYCVGSDTRYLYEMNLSTRTSRQLNCNYTRWINTDGQYVYYTNLESHTSAGVGYGNALYRIALDGLVNEKVYEDTIEGMCIQDGMLHYMSPEKKRSVLSLG